MPVAVELHFIVFSDRDSGKYFKASETLLFFGTFTAMQLKLR